MENFRDKELNFIIFMYLELAKFLLEFYCSLHLSHCSQCCFLNLKTENILNLIKIRANPLLFLVLLFIIKIFSDSVEFCVLKRKLVLIQEKS